MSRKTDFTCSSPPFHTRGVLSGVIDALQQGVKINSCDHVVGEENQNVFFQFLPIVDALQEKCLYFNW
jgi:hypothetical protein